MAAGQPAERRALSADATYPVVEKRNLPLLIAALIACAGWSRVMLIVGIYGTVLRNFGKLGRQHLSGFRVVFKEKIGDSPLRVKTYAFCCAESGWKP